MPFAPRIPQWEKDLRFAASILQTIITIPLVLLNAYLLRRRWNSPLIIVRGHVLTVIVFLGTSIYSLEMAGFNIYGPGFPDFVLDYSLAQTMALIAFPYALKAYLLIFKYEMSQYVSDLMGDVGTEAIANRNANWFVRNKKLVESPVLSLTTFFLIGSIIMATPAFSRRVNPTSDNPDFQFNAFYVFSTFLLIVYLFAKLYKRRDDHWGIRKELKNVLLIGIYEIVLWLAYAIVLTPFIHAQLPIWVLMWSGVLLMQWCSITQPLIWAKSTGDGQQKNHAGRTTSKDSQMLKEGRRTIQIRLTDYLDIPQCREAFQRHLQSEFSIENLAFWDACQKYKLQGAEYRTNRTIEVANDLISLAILIYDDYIRQDGPSCVNIAHAARSQVETTFQLFCTAVGITEKLGISGVTLGRTKTRKFSGAVARKRSVNVNSAVEIDETYLKMFDTAAAEILALMEKDSFVRFRNTPEFAETLQYFKTQISDHMSLQVTGSVHDFGSFNEPYSPSSMRSMHVPINTTTVDWRKSGPL